jgi:hypothetical protein
MSLDKEGRQLRGQLAAHTSWANTADRTARTSKPREAMMAKFAEADDPEQAKREYYQKLARKSSEARRRNKAAADKPPKVNSPTSLRRRLDVQKAFRDAREHLDGALAAIHDLREHLSDDYTEQLDSAFIHARHAYRFVDDVRQCQIIDRQ